MRKFFTVVAAGTIFCGLVQSAAAQSIPGSGPGWYGSLGTIMLNRENPEYDVIGVDAATFTTPVYTTALADFDTDFGYDLTFGRRFAGGGGLEARYFNVKMDTTLPTLFSPVGAVTPFNNPDPFSGIGLAGPVFQGATYQSRLQSFELNARQRATQNIDLLYGFRYLELAEELVIQREPAGLPALRDLHFIGGRNEMFGGQLGFDGLLFARNWFSLSAFGKSGLYYNAAYARAGDQFGNPLGSTRESRGQDDELAFVSETGLNLNIQLTRRLSLQTGYNLMYLGNVALASDQIATGNPNNGGTVIGVVGPTISQPVDTSHLWLHGMTMSLAWAW